MIPIRKPSNKKDYFVFGLSEKNNNTDSILYVIQIGFNFIGIFCGRLIIAMDCMFARLIKFHLLISFLLGRAIILTLFEGL